MTIKRPKIVIVICLLSIMGGCSSKKQQAKSWHDMPMGFTSPPARSNSQFSAMGKPGGKRTIGQKLAALGQSFKPKVKTVKVNDATSLTAENHVDTPDIYNLAGKMSSSRGQWDNAIEHYRRALELDPKNIDALSGYGYALTEQGKYKEAIAMYRKGIESGNRDLRLASEIGYCFLMDGQVDKSILTLEALTNEAPNEPIYQQQLAFALVTDGQHKAAFDTLANTIDAGQAHLRVGKIQQDLGFQTNAFSSFIAANAADPSLREANDLIASLGGTSAGGLGAAGAKRVGAGTGDSTLFPAFAKSRGENNNFPSTSFKSFTSENESDDAADSKYANADEPKRQLSDTQTKRNLIADTTCFIPPRVKAEALTGPQPNVALTLKTSEQNRSSSLASLSPKQRTTANTKGNAPSGQRNQFIVGSFEDGFAVNSGTLPIEREDEGTASVVRGSVRPPASRSLANLNSSDVPTLQFSSLSEKAFARIESQKEQEAHGIAMRAKLDLINERVARASHEDSNPKIRPLISTPRAFAKFKADVHDDERSADSRSMSDKLRGLLR